MARRHHRHGADVPRDVLGNPRDWKRYLSRLLAPERMAWQRPREVVKALGLRAGQTACEIGAGPGYFAFRLARTVGPRGHVYAADAEPRMLVLLSLRLRRSRQRNITPVLSLPGDPLLPPRSCDLILMVNTYHHLKDGSRYLRRLTQSLRPGGRLANIDFHRRETPVGPPVQHRVSREAFLASARRAGLTLAREVRGLPYQYFLVLKPSRGQARPM